ncbi:MAG TPA: heme exporter protein CcmD [Usitatibacter sp.]|nr:heme exporter protein CcmD [Usitatibacter sp.]
MSHAFYLWASYAMAAVAIAAEVAALFARRARARRLIEEERDLEAQD